MSTAAFTVRCRPLLPPSARGASHAVLEISVEDVTMADAAGQVIAREQHALADVEPRGAPEVSIAGSLDTRRRYALRVSVDLDGDGRIGPGDLLSVRSYPVRPGDQKLDVALAIVGA